MSENPGHRNLQEDSTNESILEKLEEYDFTRLCVADLNGIHLSKTVPSRHARNVLANKYELYSGCIGYGPRYEEVSLEYYGNASLIVDPDTLHSCPWLSWSDPTGKKYNTCSLICELSEQDGTIMQANPRTLAKRMLTELEQLHGLELFSGFEPEFRVFKMDGFKEACQKPTASAPIRLPVPVTLGSDFARTGMALPYQKFFNDLDNQLFGVGIDIQDFLYENGSSQLKTPLMPKFGIEPVDHYFTFKQAVREIARNHNMMASFMTCPLVGESANGCHFNHSLWDKQTKKNVLHDPNDPDNLSEIARHWIGGLVEHMPALCSLYSPTVNCYRRLRLKYTPRHPDWDVNDRLVLLRVKNKDEKDTYIENRLSSSASCGYLVVAATVAAGMDGLERKLEPPVRGRCTDNHRRLPLRLDDALEQLRADTTLTTRLGEQFVDWFTRTKRSGDLTTLRNVNIEDDSEEMLALERYEYLDFI